MAKNWENLSLQQWQEAEKAAVEEFLAFFRAAPDVAFVVYTAWTAKDVRQHQRKRSAGDGSLHHR